MRARKGNNCGSARGMKETGEKTEERKKMGENLKGALKDIFVHRGEVELGGKRRP